MDKGGAVKMSIGLKSYGKYANTRNFLRRARFSKEIELLNEYGQMGVEALMEATPVDTGKTALSWYYEIIRDDYGRISLQFNNSNLKDYLPVAILIQYGHATKSGGWVEGRDYINDAIQPIFEMLSTEVWREVTRS